MNKTPVLTDLQWAAMTAIRAEESIAGGYYRFVGSERKIAQRLLKKRYLRSRPKDSYGEYPGGYLITALGKRIFEKNPLTSIIEQFGALNYLQKVYTRK